MSTPSPEVRTSRWRAGPTTFGPVGRIVSTIVVALFFPWWGVAGAVNPLFLWALMGWLVAAGVVLRSVWRPSPVTGPAGKAERLRQRHPFLWRRLRLTRGWGLVALLVAITGAAALWTSLDDVARYLSAVVVILAGVGVFVASSNEL